MGGAWAPPGAGGANKARSVGGKGTRLVQGWSLGFMMLLTTVLGACTDSRVLGQHLPEKHCLPAVTGLPVIAPHCAESSSPLLPPGPQFPRSPDASVTPGR